ncbi:MAG: hypothetical protein DF168_00419 [Candidatus Moanabacter tarae]|uniref:Uncharacterized protein n=1 Tax=Candidatus Moanibacter tarae TaxID=2200854 RepID=A0A2Z4AE60_9BACT|nr:MAG: hypothetical protein DF168_00419 [Candidatus Moanabacter tarae]
MRIQAHSPENFPATPETTFARIFLLELRFHPGLIQVADEPLRGKTRNMSKMWDIWAKSKTQKN